MRCRRPPIPPPPPRLSLTNCLRGNAPVSSTNSPSLRHHPAHVRAPAANPSRGVRLPALLWHRRALGYSPRPPSPPLHRIRPPAQPPELLLHCLDADVHLQDTHIDLTSSVTSGALGGVPLVLPGLWQGAALESSLCVTSIRGRPSRYGKEKMAMEEQQRGPRWPVRHRLRAATSSSRWPASPPWTTCPQALSG
jgi:hypothetical protein